VPVGASGSATSVSLGGTHVVPAWGPVLWGGWAVDHSGFDGNLRARVPPPDVGRRDEGVSLGSGRVGRAGGGVFAPLARERRAYRCSVGLAPRSRQRGSAPVVVRAVRRGTLCFSGRAVRVGVRGPWAPTMSA